MVRNKEFTNIVLELLRQHKTNKQIAGLTHRHPNTVSRYVNYIRNNLIRNPKEIVNKVDSKLDEELEDMSHRNLIAYRRILTPHKFEAETKILEERKISVDIRATLQKYEATIERAVDRIITKDYTKKQVHSTPARTATT